MTKPTFRDAAPRFAERGVTLSASTVKYSQEWMRCLIDYMAAMRMNSLLWEVKISRGFEGADENGRSADGFFATEEPYVTPEQAQETLAYARDRGIKVIPEINSPGHLRTWLTHFPQYAITLSSGEPDLERLDAANPEAVQWYLDLADSYAKVFDSEWWHMGADEFENELDHRTYADYPQLAQIARERYGDAAQPWDINTAFVNTVNTHMKKQGKRLRIWNDGIRRGGAVSLEKDIVIEYWLDRKEISYSPQELAQAGHTLVSVPQYLYFSRSAKDLYDPKPQEIFEGERASLELFDGDQKVTVEGSLQLGVRLSLWPDKDWMQTPGEVLREARDTLILIGQLAWDGEKTHETWDEFKAYADSIDLPEVPEY